MVCPDHNMGSGVSNKAFEFNESALRTNKGIKRGTLSVMYILEMY